MRKMLQAENKKINIHQLKKRKRVDQKSEEKQKPEQ